MFFTFIINNSIVTNVITIDANKIIDTLEKLKDSNSKFCWVKDSLITQKAIESPKNTFLRKLYDKTNGYDSHCLLDFSKLQKYDFRKKLFFVNEQIYRFFLKIYVESKEPEADYWMSKTFFNSIIVFHYRSYLPEMQKKAINKL